MASKNIPINTIPGIDAWEYISGQSVSQGNVQFVIVPFSESSIRPMGAILDNFYIYAKSVNVSQPGTVLSYSLECNDVLIESRITRFPDCVKKLNHIYKLDFPQLSCLHVTRNTKYTINVRLNANVSDCTLYFMCGHYKTNKRQDFAAKQLIIPTTQHQYLDTVVNGSTVTTLPFVNKLRILLVGTNEPLVSICLAINMNHIISEPASFYQFVTPYMHDIHITATEENPYTYVIPCAHDINTIDTMQLLTKSQQSTKMLITAISDNYLYYSNGACTNLYECKLLNTVS
jgi:hypothetical protein